MKPLKKFFAIDLGSNKIWMLFIILLMQTIAASAKSPGYSAAAPLRVQSTSADILSRSSQSGSNQTVTVVSSGKAYVNANGRLTEVFVRIEIENIYTMHDGPYQGGNPANGELYHTTADVYVRFYSDASFTIPYTLSNDTDINIRSSWTQNCPYSPQYNSSGSGDNLFPVYANTSEQLLGNFNTHGEFISYDELAMPTNEYIASFEVLGQYFE